MKNEQVSFKIADTRAYYLSRLAECEIILRQRRRRNKIYYLSFIVLLLAFFVISLKSEATTFI